MSLDYSGSLIVPNNTNVNGVLTVVKGITFPNYYGGHTLMFGWTGAAMRTWIDGTDYAYLPYSTNITVFTWASGSLNFAHTGGSGYCIAYGSLREVEEAQAKINSVDSLLAKIDALTARVAALEARA